ncbi:O-antigen ligase [Rathayibacter sp. AY1A3]|uniref:O-antigen ligase family protein n=1 Tax=Rathayibacter sp. AY1A3 TaxID=2080521 RepID=UPI000CE8B11B|nr:hypothetical protein [Rathayibacter sp. AY1A3]PPF40860.1 hypothetical protein C5C10_01450 [Rathayibacter sp. AY1A3]
MGRHADDALLRRPTASRPSVIAATRVTDAPETRGRPSRAPADPAQRRHERIVLVFLAVLLALSVVQLYTLGPVTAPVAWSLLFLPYSVARLRGGRIDRFVVVVLLVIAGTLFALTYSGARAAALRDVVSVVSFLTPYLAVRGLGDGAWRVVGRALNWAAPVFLLQVTLTILFQLDPVQETAYLRWPDAVLFSDIYVRDIFTTSFNNVLQEKSGGFFLNGNIASMYMATTGALAFAVWRRQRGRLLLLVAVAGLVGALFTLSKTAIVLAIVLPLLVAAIRGLKGRSLGPVAWMITIPSGITAVYAVAVSFPQLAEAGLLTLGARGDFLRLAASAFPDNWLLGLGYGGWQELWLARGSQFTQHSEPRPPHNLLVTAWTNGGLLIALPVLAFLLLATVAVVRLLLRVARNEAVAVGALAVAVLWTFLHGMADNTTWFGDQHSLATLAVSVALVGVLSAEAPATPGRVPHGSAPAASAGAGRAPLRRPPSPGLGRR